MLWVCLMFMSVCLPVPRLCLPMPVYVSGLLFIWVYGPVVCMFVGPVCMYQAVFTGWKSVDLIIQECVIVALNTFIRMCDCVHMSIYVSLYVLGAVLGFLCLHLFSTL